MDRILLTQVHLFPTIPTFLEGKRIPNERKKKFKQYN